MSNNIAEGQPPGLCGTAASMGSNDEALEALLASYVAGTLSAASRALVASYLELNPEMAALVEAMEVACGDSLMAIEPVALSNPDGMLETILALPQDASASETLATAPAVRDAKAMPEHDAILLPEPLREFLGLSDGEVPWRRSLAGFHEFRVDDGDEASIRLLRLKAGQRMPDHGHDGLELTLVLSGAFSDETGHYRRGDLQIADDTLEHEPVVDGDTECICFTVVESPLRYRNRLTRFVAPLIDR